MNLRSLKLAVMVCFVISAQCGDTPASANPLVDTACVLDVQDIGNPSQPLVNTLVITTPPVSSGGIIADMPPEENEQLVEITAAQGGNNDTCDYLCGVLEFIDKCIIDCGGDGDCGCCEDCGVVCVGCTIICDGCGAICMQKKGN